MVVFPIKDTRRIESSISPEEIDQTLESALLHPFVLKQFSEGSATGLRLRITGDRLHWNTAELVRLLEKSTGMKQEEDELRDWAYLIIDAENPRFTSFYFNRTTNEVIR